MRVAVLGAYGAVGRRLLTECARHGHFVTAVGRDAARLASTPAPSHRQASVTDARAMRMIAAEHDLVVNTTGSELPELATHVTESGAAFVDISAERGYLDALRALPHLARPVLAGTGLAPGLTNLLAHAAPGSRPLQIGIIAGVGEKHGDAAREWIWRTAGTLADQNDPASGVYRSGRRFDVPGMGPRTLLRAAFGEQAQLSADTGRAVSSWLALDPPFTTVFLRLAGALPVTARYVDRLSGPLARAAPARDTWTIVIADRRRTISWARGHNQTAATAVMTALSLEPTLKASPGAYAAHNLLDIDDVRSELELAGVTISQRA
jgi:uncharacterized protein YbjT (DUF2867 family)